MFQVGLIVNMESYASLLGEMNKKPVSSLLHVSLVTVVKGELLIQGQSSLCS